MGLLADQVDGVVGVDTHRDTWLRRPSPPGQWPPGLVPWTSSRPSSLPLPRSCGPSSEAAAPATRSA